MADESRSRRMELIAAIVLGVAAVLTAWAAFRGSLVDDEVLKNYNESLTAVAAANDAFAQGDQVQSLEQNLFFQYAVQISLDNEFGALYLFDAMSPALQDAVVTWENDPDLTTPTPFDEANPAFAALDSQVIYADGAEIMAEAEALRLAAEDADDKSDVFGLSEVFFAITLFLAGFAGLLKQRKVQMGVLTLAGVILVTGLLVLVSAETSSTASALGG